MKRFKANGERIRFLRRQREHRATQAEFAHEVRISERQLRDIEKGNREIRADVLDRISRALGVKHHGIVYAVDGPTLVCVIDPGRGRTLSKDTRSSEDQQAVVYPRHSEAYASATSDEVRLFDSACAADVIVSCIQTRMTPEVSACAEELLDLLRSLSHRERPQYWIPIDGREALRTHRRIHELIVFLKGNDIWIYIETHFKKLPERDSVAPDDAPYVPPENQLIVAIAPAGEYGETTVKVPIDYGQPWVCDNSSLPF